MTHCVTDCAEMGAIGGALSSPDSQPAQRVLPLGSNKSCYGHTEGAAGRSELGGSAVRVCL